MLLPTRTKPFPNVGSADIFEDSRSADVEEAGPLLAGSEDHTSHYANAFEKPRGFVQQCIEAAKKLISLIRGRRNFQVLLCSFFLTALASSDTKLLVQYISKRYEWTFAQVRVTIINYFVADTDALSRQASCYQQRQ